MNACALCSRVTDPSFRKAVLGCRPVWFACALFLRGMRLGNHLLGQVRVLDLLGELTETRAETHLTETNDMDGFVERFRAQQNTLAFYCFAATVSGCDCVSACLCVCVCVCVCTPPVSLQFLTKCQKTLKARSFCEAVSLQTRGSSITSPSFFIWQKHRHRDAQ